VSCEHVLWLHSKCHPEAYLAIACVPGSDRLLVVCDQCGATVAAYHLTVPLSSDLSCDECQEQVPPREQMS
jgi:hypothetical protein